MCGGPKKEGSGPGWPRHKSKTIQKITKVKRFASMVEVVEHLPK
jgi:hypothetical protein